MVSSGFIARLFLSLILFSQSLLAVSMPCSELVSDPAAIAADAHAHHPMDSAVPDLGSAADDSRCCDGGYCSIGGCLTLSTVPGIQIPGALPAINRVGSAPPHRFESHPPDTLLRPPIKR